MKRIRFTAILSAVVLTATGASLTACKETAGNGTTTKIEITNVSYDPTRELYEEFNGEFAKHWKEETGQEVEITQSHGGSGSQARSVIEGNEADVVTLALAYDITAIENKGMIKAGWQDEFKHNSAPYTSTIVFLVRKGNPKDIQDWDDIVKDGVGVITPNPKTSGGARWNYLAAWAYADKLYDGDEVKVKGFIGDLFANVLVLDSGARGSTTTFVENKQGDVLLAWENEAYLALDEYPGEYEIVTPSISMLAEPPVAIIDEVADRKGTAEVAKAYLEYLYTDVGQTIAADNYYRPTNQDILSKYADTFDLNVELITIDDELFGGWNNTQTTHFADGGVFDEIYDE
ncbi:MAG TPA: sulfate ABC transporter substrate-binding protein [Clostridiales bacterium]|nr:sulfate ABC transporter substrate-binding protein [Clostridiales bacterium]